MLIFSSIQKYSGHLTQFFNVIIQGTLMLFAMQTPIDVLFLAMYWNPTNWKGYFKGNLGIFHTFQWSLFEFWGIYQYQIVLENVQLKYLWTEYSHWQIYKHTLVNKNITKISFTTNCTHNFTNSLPAPVSQSNLQPLFPDL